MKDGYAQGRLQGHEKIKYYVESIMLKAIASPFGESVFYPVAVVHMLSQVDFSGQKIPQPKTNASDNLANIPFSVDE